jgi:cytochrome c553
MTKLYRAAVLLPLLGLPLGVAADPAHQASQEIEKALHLTPDPDNGRRVYATCAVCHMPEGWGEADGSYPVIAGQHAPVIVKQMADIRARNRDTPTMLPFTMLEHLSLQEVADVSAYIAALPMTPDNGVGPGDDLAHGAALYERHCDECHGPLGEGYAERHAPRIQGQHYRYLVRQYHWIRDGKRRNGDGEMIAQSRTLSERDIAAVMDHVARLRPQPILLADPGWRNPDFPKFHRPASLAYGGNEGL